jgi:hypothetical protein
MSALSPVIKLSLERQFLREGPLDLCAGQIHMLTDLFHWSLVNFHLSVGCGMSDSRAAIKKSNRIINDK